MNKNKDFKKALLKAMYDVVLNDDDAPEEIKKEIMIADLATSILEKIKQIYYFPNTEEDRIEKQNLVFEYLGFVDLGLSQFIEQQNIPEVDD